MWESSLESQLICTVCVGQRGSEQRRELHVQRTPARSDFNLNGEDTSSTDSCRGILGRRAGELGVEKDEERNFGPMITLEN